MQPWTQGQREKLGQAYDLLESVWTQREGDDKRFHNLGIALEALESATELDGAMRWQTTLDGIFAG